MKCQYIDNINDTLIQCGSPEEIHVNGQRGHPWSPSPVDTREQNRRRNDMAEKAWKEAKWAAFNRAEEERFRRQRENDPGGERAPSSGGSGSTEWDPPTRDEIRARREGRRPTYGPWRE